jgi:hypothetical protein
MKIQKGDIIELLTQELARDHSEMVFGFGSNSVFGHRGLVMGAGAAKAFADALPWLPARFKALFESGWRKNPYHLIEAHCPNGASILAMQTKYHWHDQSPPSLVQASIAALNEYSQRNPTREIHITAPGIGLGGLDRDLVFSWLEPVDVTVWTW